MAAQFYDQNGELRLDGTLVGGGGAQVASLLGPYPLDYTDFNAAVGSPIVLSPELAVGQLIEPVAFFPTFFDNGSPDNRFILGMRTTGSVSTGEAVQYDGNAPSDEAAEWGVSGLFNFTGAFPRRAVYRIKDVGVTLGVTGPASGLTQGSMIVWAFVWTP